MGNLRFLYDKKDTSFVDSPPPVDAHANSEPPHNCTTCALREEEMQLRGCIIRKAGTTIGVAVHGTTFHLGDFALLRAEKGPARMLQLVGFILEIRSRSKCNYLDACRISWIY